MMRKNYFNLVLLFLFACLTQTGCAVVGFSSNSGWFFWPGGWIGALIMVVIIGVMLWKQFHS